MGKWGESGWWMSRDDAVTCIHKEGPVALFTRASLNWTLLLIMWETDEIKKIAKPNEEKVL